MKIRSFLSWAALAVAVMAGPAVASANTQYFDISGNDGFGAFSGQMVLDVVGGYAVSGGGAISGAGIPGVQDLNLITLSTPNANYGGTVGYRFSGGTDFFGFESPAPIDLSGGLLFAIGPSIPPWGTGLGFGIWNNGSPGYGNNYQGGFFGQIPGSDSFYYITGPITAAAPEPATWAMMLLGFAGLGFAGYRRMKKNTPALAAA
jgi:hypothetical protein